MQVFGKFAKGAAAFSAGDGTSSLEELVHRVKETSALSEKRTALHDIKDIVQDSTEAKAAFGSLDGIALMVELLTLREDLELVRAALEILVAAFGREEGTGAAPTNCQLFIQSHDHLAVLVSLLEPASTGIDDFYVYYHTVQILNSCLENGLYQLQEVLSRREDGLHGLLRLLSEREAIRNEVLLILIRLTTDHGSLQEAAAKGGVFRMLFDIIKWEGGSEGGIVVRDCLDLMKCLLTNNQETQKLFREAGGMTRLLKFLELADVVSLGAEALRTANQSISHQKTANLELGLALSVLLTADNPLAETRVENCRSLNQADCLPVFSQLCLNQGGRDPVDARTKALRCMGQVLSCVPEAKTLLLKLRVFLDGQPTEALLALLRAALNAQEMEEASAALFALHGFFDDNPDAQERSLASVLVFEGRAPLNGLFLSEVLQSADTCRQGSEIGRRAIQVLAFLVRGNPTVQSAFVNQTVPLPRGQGSNRLIYWLSHPGGPEQTVVLSRLMDLLSETLQFGGSAETCIALALCAVDCIDGCPTAIEFVLQIEVFVTLLVTHLQKSVEAVATAMPWTVTESTAVAVLFAAEGDAISALDVEAMRDYFKNILAGSVGVDRFLYFLQALVDKEPNAGLWKLRPRIYQIQPLLQNFLRPGVPIRDPSVGEPVQLMAVVDDGEAQQRGEREQQFTDLQVELQTTKAELQTLRERQSLELSQRDSHIQALQHQIAELQESQRTPLDAKREKEMTICLGIEHTKVRVLASKLYELGYDPEALLSTEMHKHI